MARAIWSGSIGFGLVNAPVRMYSAIHEEDLHFHLLHATDGGRIGYQKVCKAEDDRPVPADEIVRAYEYAKDDLVILTDEDFAAAEGEESRQIAVTDFVPYEQIDPIHFERTYYLGPDEGAERVYALLARAMADSGLAAVARYVFHGKENLGVLRVRDGVITLEKMYYADEVRPSDGIAPSGRAAEVGDEELEMARRLISAYAGDFDIGRYHDRHRERLLEVIERRHRGERIAPVEAPAPEAPPDLLAALRASLDAMGGGAGEGGARGDAPGPGGPAGGEEDLGALTVDELRERARAAGVRGRSKMTKAELQRALRAA